MDYAVTLLVPIIGGLMLGLWLTNTYGLSPIWTVVLAILGMMGGIGIMYKRYAYPQLYKDKKEGAVTPVKPLPKKQETAYRHWTDLEKTGEIDDQLPDEFADEFDDDEDWPGK